MTYVNTVASWFGDDIAVTLGVPGFGEKTIYNYVAFAFWLTTGPVDVALIWSNPI